MYRLSSLVPMERYLAYLTTFPAPDDACIALMRGPLAPLGARVGSVWARYDDDELRVIGSYQSSQGTIQRYGSIPLDLDLPIARCVVNGEMLIHKLDTITQTFPALALDTAIWEDLALVAKNGSLVSQPVFAAGIPVGAVGFISTQTRGFIESFAPMLSSLSSAVALWLTHPQTQQSVNTLGLNRESTDSLRLTARQQRILLLISDGKSNAAIAHLLGYSLSTVKQELQRTLSVLRVDNRQAAVVRARELGLLASALAPDSADIATDIATEHTGT